MSTGWVLPALGRIGGRSRGERLFCFCKKKFFPGPKYSESERWICQSQYEFGDVNVEAKH